MFWNFVYAFVAFGTLALASVTSTVTFSDFYHWSSITIDFIISIGFAFAFLLSLIYQRSRKKQILIVALVSLITTAAIQAVAISTCQGEECLGAYISLPINFVFLIVTFWLLITFFLYLNRKKVMSFVLIAFFLLSCFFCSYGMSKWDNQCSIPDVPDGKRSCIVRKSLPNKDYTLCNKVTGVRSETNLHTYCIDELSQKTNNPDLCRQYLTGYDKDACLAEFMRLTKDTSFCSEITHPDVRKYYCNPQSCHYIFRPGGNLNCNEP